MTNEDTDYQDRMVGLFTALRAQSLHSAMIGLWLDLLRWPLNEAAAEPEKPKPDNSFAEKNLRTARQIVDLLSDEVGRFPSQSDNEAETDDDFRLRCLEQWDDAQAREAGEVLDGLARTAVSEIHARLDRGFPREALPRFAAVLRAAVGNDALLGQYIDLETGEFLGDRSAD